MPVDYTGVRTYLERLAREKVAAEGPLGPPSDSSILRRRYRKGKSGPTYIGPSTPRSKLLPSASYPAVGNLVRNRERTSKKHISEIRSALSDAYGMNHSANILIRNHEHRIKRLQDDLQASLINGERLDRNFKNIQAENAYLKGRAADAERRIISELGDLDYYRNRSNLLKAHLDESVRINESANARIPDLEHMLAKKSRTSKILAAAAAIGGAGTLAAGYLYRKNNRDR